MSVQIVREDVFHQLTALGLDTAALIQRGFTPGGGRLHEIDICKYRRKTEPELRSMAVANQKVVAHSAAFLKTNGWFEIFKGVFRREKTSAYAILNIRLSVGIFQKGSDLDSILWIAEGNPFVAKMPIPTIKSTMAAAEASRKMFSRARCRNGARETVAQQISRRGCPRQTKRL